MRLNPSSESTAVDRSSWPRALRALLTVLASVAWLSASACTTDSGGTDAIDDAAEVEDSTGDVADTSEPDGDADTADDTDTAGDAGDVGPSDTSVAGCSVRTPADFDDHSVTGFDSEACLLAFGSLGSNVFQVKFTMIDFYGVGSPVHFYDPNFFSLHDEWYWFRLLNGADVAGSGQTPLTGESFATVGDIYLRYAGVAADDLPLGLRWAGDRLYSRHFYDIAMETPTTENPDAPRRLGVGSILFFPDHPDRATAGDIWAFELEYNDRVTPSAVARFVAKLEAALPSDVGPRLRFLARSPQQEGVVASIRGGTSTLKDRVLTYDDVVIDGDVEGYNPGITAGRIKLFPSGTFSPTDVGPETIAVLERIPDDIPPVAGIVTAVPQTALAHINLLAASRGTPNAYVAGIMQDGDLGDYAAFLRYVILDVDSDSVRWKLMSNADYQTYRGLFVDVDRTIPQVADLSTADYFVDLAAHDLTTMRSLVPLVGGKSAGFTAFEAVPSIETPPAPLALSIRGYAEHFAPDLGLVTALTESDLFKTSARVRYVALEGVSDFRDANADSPQNLAWVQSYINAHQGTNDVHDVVMAAGGVKRMLRDRPIDPAYLALVRSQLESRFAALAPTQGLRFRSSSTAEDASGFNGAGLYDSNTGFLNPELQPETNDQKKSIEWALKKTWASYWGFPAFEERRVAGIAHLDGNMGVTVHPRFDDPLEASNGVITFYLSHYTNPPTRRMVVNVQDGAVSVTNPDNMSLPEIVEVIGTSGTPTITRVQPSTIVEAGEVVLTDAQLQAMFAQVDALSDAWLAQAIADGDPTQAPASVVLDLEFKVMASGWPALASSETAPGGLIYKQVRVLDGAPRVAGYPAGRDWFYLPSDLATVAKTVRERSCASALFRFESLTVETEPSAATTMPFDTQHFGYRFDIRFYESHPDFPWQSSASGALKYELPHFALTEPLISTTSGWPIVVAVKPEQAMITGFDRLELKSDGSYRFERGSAVLEGQFGCISPTVIHASPSDFLRELMDP